MGLVFEYPSGFIVLCLLVGALYAFTLYFFSERRKSTPQLWWVLFLFRFLSVSFICLLLLSPLIKQTETTLEKPLVILGLDNSASIISTNDSDFYKKEWEQSIKQLETALQKKCDVKIFTFGDQVLNGSNLTFAERETDISSFFQEVENRYSNRNTGALIIATDGLYNKGTDPLYAAKKISFPIYSIALGDTVLKKDILIHKVACNKTVFKDDKFPVEIFAEMDYCDGIKSKLIMRKGSVIVEQKEILGKGDRTMIKTTFQTELKQPGIYRYSIEIEPVSGELTAKNNKRDFLVEVLDNRQKIALLYDAPHPDITTLLKSLEGSSRFEIEQFKPENMPTSLEKYDLVILYQIPSIMGSTNMNSLIKSAKSLLFILGSRSDLNSFNNLKTGLIINAKQSATTDPQAVINDNFSLFTMDPNEKNLFNGFPPLQSPFGVYQYGPLSEVLAFQKIGSIRSNNPLFIFLPSPDRKIGVITGENLWRWRFSNFVQRSNYELFDDLLNKVAHYLAVKEDKSFFRIKVSNRIEENSPVEMEAELYNQNYELVNEPLVNITVSDEGKRNYPFTFTRTDHAYYLNAGIFPIGNYSYTATVILGNNHYSQKGNFFIEALSDEYSNLVADHQLLYNLSAAHDGQVVPPREIETLVKKIFAREDFKTVSISQKRFEDLLGNPWIFIAILSLLTIEWVIRKRQGW
ncbi:MAG: hypothetical protein PHF97_05875 [Bacteroidales bacterium]|nr:hypothetical protein [Bacteroidales bacterium]